MKRAAVPQIDAEAPRRLSPLASRIESSVTAATAIPAGGRHRFSLLTPPYCTKDRQSSTMP